MFLYSSKAFTFRMAVAILRLPKGQDYSHLNLEVVNPAFSTNGLLTRNDSAISNLGQSPEHITGDLKASQLMHADSNLNLAGMISSHSTITAPPQPRMCNI